jgi:DNA-binding CsgD family transcriptional regulator
MQAALIELDKPVPRQLTGRESEIVRKVATGMRNAEVGARLSLSEPTVKTHLYKIFKKLGIRNRIQLTHYALRTGLVTLAVKNRSTGPRTNPWHESAQRRTDARPKGAARRPTKPDNRAAAARFASSSRLVSTD